MIFDIRIITNLSKFVKFEIACTSHSTQTKRMNGLRSFFNCGLSTGLINFKLNVFKDDFVGVADNFPTAFKLRLKAITLTA